MNHGWVRRFFLFAAGFLLAGVFVSIHPTHAAYEILNGSVVGLYHLEDVSDSSGNGYNLTNVGSVAFSTALLSNGADIGSNQWLTYPSNMGWASTNDSFSVAFWFKQNAEITSSEETLFHLDSSAAGDYNYIGYQYNGGNRRFYYGYNSGYEADYISLGTGWHFFVYTRDGSGDRNLYLDGQSVASNTTNLVYNPGDNQFSIGSYVNNSTNGTTNGVFDETVFFNTVISTSTISALYNGGSGNQVCVTSGCGTGITIPSILSGSLKQFKSDGITQIGEGSSTNESTVFLAGTLESASSSDWLQLQVEISTGTFSNIPTATSSVVQSGNIATATVVNLLNGSYVWQAKVLDTTNAVSSSWQRGGSATPDFVVAVPTSTAAQFAISDGSVVGLYHLENTIDSSGYTRNLTNVGSTHFAYSLLNDGADIGSNQWLTYLSNMGWTSTSDSFSVAFWFKQNAEITSSEETLFHLDSTAAKDYNYVGYQYNNGNRRLYYGYNSGYAADYTNLGIGWHFIVYTRDGSGSRNLYLDGANVANNTTGATYDPGDNQFSIGSYVNNSSNGTTNGVFDETVVLNRVMTSDEISGLYNGGHGAEVCLVAGCATTNLTLSSLNQYKSDATTTIAESVATTESTVVFGATLNSSATSTEQLQVEVEPAGTSFTGIPNATSTFVLPGSSVTVRYGDEDSTYGLSPESSSDGSYHWQARVMDSHGVTSTWQMFGSTASSTDFVINTVPLYTQIGSPYPSFASTSVMNGGWAGDTYDDGTAYCGGGNTIGYCGCVITSVAMDLRYFGITADTLGNNVDPRGLNIWLTNHGGYSPSGDLNWSTIVNYASSTNGGAIAYDPNSGQGYGSTLSAMRPYLDPLLASSTPVPVILTENQNGHYVIATGIADNNGTSTYTLRDAAWYLTQYLNQSTSTDKSNTVYGYSNLADGVHIYYDPPQVPLWSEYHTDLPNTLMLVDSQGRRTGKDPASGIVYHEIPDTSYGEDGISLTNRDSELFISDLPDGEYTIYVFGGSTGPYWFEAINSGGLSQVLRGNIQSGSMVAYVQNYNSTNLASSTFSLQGTASSTASITAMVAHNLPPPPLPTPIIKAPPPILDTRTPTATASSSALGTPLNFTINSSATSSSKQ